MTDKEHRPSCFCDISNFSQTFFLESSISHGQDFVDYQDLCLKMGSYRKRQADIHPARVVLHRCVDEPLDLGESDDFIELSVDFHFFHPQDSAVQVNIFSAGELRVKSSTHLEQGTDPAMNFGRAGCWLGDTGEDLQESAFARPITANNAHHRAMFDLKRDIFEGPNGFCASMV